MKPRNMISPPPTGCHCPHDAAEVLNRQIESDESLCPVHDAVEMQQREAEAEVEHLTRIRDEVFGPPAEPPTPTELFNADVVAALDRTRTGSWATALGINPGETNDNE